MHGSFTGAASVIAIVLCVTNTIIVVAFVAHIWLQGWLIRRSE